MEIFADSAHSFISERPDARLRELAWSSFDVSGLPTTTDEVWRYAPLKELNLDNFAVTSTPSIEVDSSFASQLCARSGLVVRVVDGFLISSDERL